MFPQNTAEQQPCSTPSHLRQALRPPEKKQQQEKKTKNLCTRKHEIGSYFTVRIRQMCSEFRCLEGREVPQIQQEEVEEGVGEEGEAC